MSDSAGFPLPAHDTGTVRVKRGLAEMLKGGVIMDVVTPEQAKIAEDAGAMAVMALERVPADEDHHIDKWAFTVPFVCGATNLGEALRRISEGAAMIRSKGEAGTGNIVEAVRHLRSILGDIRKITRADSAEIYDWAKQLRAPVGLVQEIAETGTLPVPLFCAGGIATPADAALVMQLGALATFVGSGIFKSDDPARRAKAIVEATAHFDAPDIVAKVSRGLGEAMRGQEIDQLEVKLADRGWWGGAAIRRAVTGWRAEGLTGRWCRTPRGRRGRSRHPRSTRGRRRSRCGSPTARPRRPARARRDRAVTPPRRRAGATGRCRRRRPRCRCRRSASRRPARP